MKHLACFLTILVTSVGLPSLAFAREAESGSPGGGRTSDARGGSGNGGGKKAEGGGGGGKKSEGGGGGGKKAEGGGVSGPKADSKNQSDSDDSPEGRAATQEHLKEIDRSGPAGVSKPGTNGAPTSASGSAPTSESNSSGQRNNGPSNPDKSSGTPGPDAGTNQNASDNSAPRSDDHSSEIPVPSVEGGAVPSTGSPAPAPLPDPARPQKNSPMLAPANPPDVQPSHPLDPAKGVIPTPAETPKEKYIPNLPKGSQRPSEDTQVLENDPKVSRPNATPETKTPEKIEPKMPSKEDVQNALNTFQKSNPGKAPIANVTAEGKITFTTEENAAPPANEATVNIRADMKTVETQKGVIFSEPLEVRDDPGRANRFDFDSNVEFERSDVPVSPE